MLIVPHVCAEFHDGKGVVLYNVRPDMLHIVVEAPESIRQDPLFDMLVREGTLIVPDTKVDLKQLENDPVPATSEPEQAEAVAEEAAAVESATEKKTPGRKNGKA